MNIFALDNDPETAGKWHCDDHCNKMYLEHLQCLANYFTLEQLEDAPVTKKGTPWKHTHSKHPSVLWLGESISNVEWLIELNNVLESERLVRNYNPHHSTPFFNWVKKNYKSLPIPVKSQTPFSIAINEDSKCRAVNPNFDKLDPVQQYREFYIHDKTFATYEGANPPNWLPTYEIDGIFYHLHYEKKSKTKTYKLVA